MGLVFFGGGRYRQLCCRIRDEIVAKSTRLRVLMPAIEAGSHPGDPRVRQVADDLPDIGREICVRLTLGDEFGIAFV